MKSVHETRVFDHRAMLYREVIVTCEHHAEEDNGGSSPLNQFQNS